MTETERSLLYAVLENPDDDLPRLVYADYLDENGDPKRAEFIRLQIEFTQHFRGQEWDSDEYIRLVKRMISLHPSDYSLIIKQCRMPSCDPGNLWIDDLQEKTRVRNTQDNINYHFHRGFIDTVTADWTTLRNNIQAIAFSPIKTLFSFNQGDYGGIRIEISQSKKKKWISKITFERNWVQRIKPIQTVWISRQDLFDGIMALADKPVITLRNMDR